MMHTLKLDDMELTALITHLEGQSEMMVESRLNSSNPSELPDREEVLLNLVYAKAFTICWDADKDPNNDFDLIKNHQNNRVPQKLFQKLFSLDLNNNEIYFLLVLNYLTLNILSLLFYDPLVLKSLLFRYLKLIDA